MVSERKLRLISFLQIIISLNFTWIALFILPHDAFKEYIKYNTVASLFLVFGSSVASGSFYKQEIKLSRVKTVAVTMATINIAYFFLFPIEVAVVAYIRYSLSVVLDWFKEYSIRTDLSGIVPATVVEAFLTVPLSYAVVEVLPAAVGVLVVYAIVNVFALAAIVIFSNVKYADLNGMEHYFRKSIEYFRKSPQRFLSNIGKRISKMAAIENSLNSAEDFKVLEVQSAVRTSAFEVSALFNRKDKGDYVRKKFNASSSRLFRFTLYTMLSSAGAVLIVKFNYSISMYLVLVALDFVSFYIYSFITPKQDAKLASLKNKKIIYIAYALRTALMILQASVANSIVAMTVAFTLGEVLVALVVWIYLRKEASKELLKEAKNEESTRIYRD